MAWDMAAWILYVMPIMTNSLEHDTSALTAVAAPRLAAEGLRLPDRSDTPGPRRSARLAGRLGPSTES
ncbi:uncharacterized protein N7503_006480 [Penicillium pulvis]|uniref:uncharacterized protein n=1 Tax=Penicillium pulvis TaxID=1562058 RepID=UPI00254711ED|nr:uncharacterized protein N7503_006480 [Penicillium pulvis]KAJ5798975.1 hypothetical protein N7503_006480 [Penicillium pulvis]